MSVGILQQPCPGACHEVLSSLQLLLRQHAHVHSPSYTILHLFLSESSPLHFHVQVFVALLRTCEADGRKALVRQALDVLTPALERRLPPPGPGDRYPIWVRYTKKVLVEEGHQMNHLIHIWQLLVRHADMFYASR